MEQKYQTTFDNGKATISILENNQGELKKEVIDTKVALKLDKTETDLKNNNSSVANSQRLQEADEIPLDKSRDSSLEDTKLKPESKISAVVISSIEQLKIEDMKVQKGKKTVGNTTRQSPPKVLVQVDRHNAQSSHYQDPIEAEIDETLHGDTQPVLMNSNNLEMMTPFDANSKNYGDTMRRLEASKPQSVDRKVVDITKNVSQDQNNLDLFIEDDSQMGGAQPEEMTVPQASVEVKG